MYANRYPITLRLALREIWIVSRDIWSQYRADARMRSDRRRDARIRERTYRYPGETFDRSLGFLAVICILAFIGITLTEAWGWIDTWLFGASGTAKAVTTAMALRQGRLKPDSKALLRHLLAHPGLTALELHAQFPEVSKETLRRRLIYLMNAGYVERLGKPREDGDSGPPQYVWHVLDWPEQEEAVAVAAEPEPPRPIVPPRRPDHTQPWTTPYLSNAGRRPGADDFRRAPTLQGGHRHAYQAKP